MPAKKEFPNAPSLELQHALLVHPETNPTGYVALENAISHPFLPDATEWSRVNAWWLADASWLAYAHDPASVQQAFARAGLPSCEPIASGGTEAYLAHDDHLAILAFRGTQPDDWDDLFNDVRFAARAWDVGFVHEGFADALARVWNQVASAVARLPGTCRLWVTGHSLGGALAALAAVRLGGRVTGLYTFGCPRIGDAVFAAHVGRQFHERSVRYSNDQDVVTHVPPQLFAFPGRYTHVDQLRTITPDGHVGPARPAIEHFIEDIFGSPRIFLDIVDFSKRGTRISLPDALSDHTPLYYALHTWNDFAVNG